MAVIGAIGVRNNFELWNGNSARNRRANIYSYIFLAGATADILSIPFFISARTNKRKASFTINNQKLHLQNPNISTFQILKVPLLSVRIKF